MLSFARLSLKLRAMSTTIRVAVFSAIEDAALATKGPLPPQSKGAAVAPSLCRRKSALSSRISGLQNSANDLAA